MNYDVVIIDHKSKLQCHDCTELNKIPFYISCPYCAEVADTADLIRAAQCSFRLTPLIPSLNGTSLELKIDVGLENIEEKGVIWDYPPVVDLQQHYSLKTKPSLSTNSLEQPQNDLRGCLDEAYNFQHLTLPCMPKAGNHSIQLH